MKIDTASFSVEFEQQMIVTDLIRIDLGIDRVKGSLEVLLFLSACCNFLGTLLNRFPELGSRDQFIHQFPLQSAFTTDALGDGAEKIGMIPANFPFIHHSRQPPVPGNTASKGTSGSETVLELSSTSMMCSVASAIS